MQGRLCQTFCWLEASKILKSETICTVEMGSLGELLLLEAIRRLNTIEVKIWEAPKMTFSIFTL